MPKETIKIGDIVRIIDPRRVAKVGYEKDLDYYYAIAGNDPIVANFCDTMELDPLAVDRVIKAVASHWVGQRKEFSCKREIFFEDISYLDVASKEFRVINKHSRQIGTYWPSEWYYGYQPHLKVDSVIVILKLRPHEWGGDGESEPEKSPDYAYGLYLPTTHVELVRKG